MLFNTKFILASSSASRYKILKNNNLEFYKIIPNCKETPLKKSLIKNKTPLIKISLELARLKSKNISKFKKNIMVVGSDTTIIIKNKILNKAKNLKEAKNKIKLLSGSFHEVCSSASVFFNEKELWNATQKTKVKIRNLENKEIDIYLKKYGKDILSSVGCYQVELGGANIIEEIKGDFFNVMGFPLFPFLKFLKQNNINK